MTQLWRARSPFISGTTHELVSTVNGILGNKMQKLLQSEDMLVKGGWQCALQMALLGFRDNRQHSAWGLAIACVVAFVLELIS